MKSSVKELQIDALRSAGNTRRSDAIAVEEPLEIRLMREGLPEADENGGTGRSISGPRSTRRGPSSARS